MARGKELLSDIACRKAKARDAVHYLNDGAGLRLRIRPNGTKDWLLRYTLPGRAESTHKLGAYPATTLEQARAAARDARRLIDKGRSPTIERKLERAATVEAQAATFAAVAAEWLERSRPNWSAHHYERNEGLLRRILLPELGPLPITEISEASLLRVLQASYDAGTKESARRARAVAQQVFAFAKDTHRATENPARDLAGNSMLAPVPVKHFAAIKADQVGAMLRALAKSECTREVKAALCVLLYTGARDGALRAAQWREFDLKAGTWTLPEARRKTRKRNPGDQRIPLPAQAVAILKDLAKRGRPTPDDFVFASAASKAGYLAENTLRLALHGLGFDVTAHGFRSLLADVLNTAGFNRDAVERQLDHTEENAVRAAYLRDDFYSYRAQMMQWFADWAEAQYAGKKKVPALPENVLPFRRAAA